LFSLESRCRREGDGRQLAAGGILAKCNLPARVERLCLRRAGKHVTRPLNRDVMPRDRPRRIPLDVGGLIGRADIFRVSQGVKRDPDVDMWLADDPVELRSIAQRWFMEMRQCGDDVRELMHDGCPVACVGDAPFGYVNAFRNHVNVGFFYGAKLEDPAGLLEGSGKRMRHVKVRPGAEPDNEGLRDLVHAAYLDIKARLRGAR
jgi:hypothetical protein